MLIYIPGNVLLSHKVSLAVPSALEGLTSVFGMGTGVAPPLQSPGKPFEYLPAAADRAGAGTRHSCPKGSDGGWQPLWIPKCGCERNFALGKFYGQASRPISTR